MNKPYIKEINEFGDITNLITKDNPYLHRHVSVRGKSKKLYIPFHHPLTGRFMGKIKKGGNNRAWKDGKPRIFRLS